MSAKFKQRLLAGEPLLGTFVKTPSSIVCEVLGRSALQAVCLDAEHAPFDRAALDACVYALRSEGMPSLVRVQSDAPEQLLNALDIGATGVVVPHVTSVVQAESIARHCQFGARGRGYAGSTRAAAYTTKPMQDHLADSAAGTTVIAQIEDLEALEDIDAIARVDGIDCLFIGRIDLTVALGASSPQAPEVIEAVDRICEVCVAAGRRVGMFVASVDEVAQWRNKGANLFLLASDHTFLLQGAKRLAEAFSESGN